MKVGVLDDDTHAANTVISYLYRYMAEKNVNFAVKAYRSAEALLKDFDDSFDILLLDIEMAGMTGMELAKEIRRTNESVVIVFITNMAQYAIEGYEVQAVDYILKPVTYPDFIMKFLKAVKSVSDDRNKAVSISTETGVIAIPVNAIYYVEVLKNNVFYHTSKTVYRTRATLKSVEEKLRNFAFVKINSCYLVNMKHISKIVGDTAYVGDTPLKISRNKKADFLKTFTSYMGKI